MISRANLQLPERGADSCEPAKELVSAFPVLTPEAVRRIGQTGLLKVGAAFDIRNQRGDMLLARHRVNPSNGVANGEWSVFMETVMGLFKDTSGALVANEPTERTLRRCLQEEVGLDLVDVEGHITSAPASGQRNGVWDLGRDDTPSGGMRAYAVTTALQVDHYASTWFATEWQPTDEVDAAGFFPPEEVEEIIRTAPTRAGFRQWYAEQQAFMAQSGADAFVSLQFPHIPEFNGYTWHDLRFTGAAAGNLALNQAID